MHFFLLLPEKYTKTRSFMRTFFVVLQSPIHPYLSFLDLKNFKVQNNTVFPWLPPKQIVACKMCASRKIQDANNFVSPPIFP